MIERIIIKGYRCFAKLDLAPNPGMNIIVGDNESGKSTLLEAVSLGLTGKVKWPVGERRAQSLLVQRGCRQRLLCKVRDSRSGGPSRDPD